MTVEVYDPSAHQGADYILQVRVKNGPLLRAIRLRGYRTITSFSIASRLHLTAIHKYLSLARAPINKKGEWSRTALRMAAFLHLPPDSLFPEQHLETALARSSGEMEISKEDVALLMDQRDDLSWEEKEDRDAMVAGLLARLSPRQQHVVKRLYGFDGKGGTTESQIADELGISRGRANQIHLDLLRKLKRPSLQKTLKNWQDGLSHSA